MESKKLCPFSPRIRSFIITRLLIFLVNSDHGSLLKNCYLLSVFKVARKRFSMLSARLISSIYYANTFLIFLDL